MSPSLPHSLNLAKAVEALHLILQPLTEEIVQEQRMENKATTEIHRIDLPSSPIPVPKTSTVKRISMSPNKKKTIIKD